VPSERQGRRGVTGQVPSLWRRGPANDVIVLSSAYNDDLGRACLGFGTLSPWRSVGWASMTQKCHRVGSRRNRRALMRVGHRRRRRPERSSGDRIELLEPRVLLAIDVTGVLPSDATWSGTVRVTSDVVVAGGRSLTIEPGTVIKFAPGQALYVDGVIRTLGTSDQPVQLTSVFDDSFGEDVSPGDHAPPSPGDWEALYLRSEATLQHTNVRYAGDTNYISGGGRTPAVQLSGGGMITLSDVTVNDVANTGIYIAAGSPELTNVSVSRARETAYFMELAAAPRFENVQSEDSQGDHIGLRGGVLPQPDRQLDPGGDLPIHVYGDLVVAGGRSLTIAPGTVLKMQLSLIHI